MLIKKNIPPLILTFLHPVRQTALADPSFGGQGEGNGEWAKLFFLSPAPPKDACPQQKGESPPEADAPVFSAKGGSASG
ncbi:MAG: hypothetical protein A2Z83_06800 [Omnitrophica bacterium GWA2_52_8]|nr:MAG: hypothetical protein A2Z83_06800 [Omnitrophica bacterium GWA2_52_8]